MKKYMLELLLIAPAIIAFQACNKNAVTPAQSDLLALPASAAAPVDNSQTDAKINLGRQLFWDPILSGNKDVACASCHHPAEGYCDNLDLSIGVNGVGLGANRHFGPGSSFLFAKRNSPTILNAAFNGMDENGNYDPSTAPMFLDNRKQSLEMQSLEPIKSLEEMRGTAFTAQTALDSVVARLKGIPEYAELFKSAFPDDEGITAGNIAKAIAAFERTLLSVNSPYDRYARGEISAMSQSQIQGLNAFIRTGCAKCHSGPMFSDYELHVMSVPDNSQIATDAGSANTYAFRTMSLRNLSLTAPYMHNGVFKTLDQVIQFYDRVGGGNSQNAHVQRNALDPKLRGINDHDKELIIGFLKALEDNAFDRTIPDHVPSNLRPGGNL